MIGSPRVIAFHLANDYNQQCDPFRDAKWASLAGAGPAEPGRVGILQGPLMSLRLTFRVAAPSVFISLLLLVSGSLGAWYVQHLQRSAAATLDLDMTTIHAAQQLVFSITELQAETSNMVVDVRRGRIDSLLTRCFELERHLDATGKLVDDAEEMRLVAAVRAGCNETFESLRNLAQAPPGDVVRQKLDQLNREVVAHRVLAPAKELLELEVSLNRQSAARSQRTATGMAWVLWLFGAFGAAAGLVAGVGIARSVTRSIVELYVPVRVVSGKLEEVVGPVEVLPSGGIDNLDLILRRMSDQVGTVVDRLQRSQLAALRSEQMAAMGQLAAGMAHELRNPLTAMKMLIQNASGEGPARGLTDRDLAVLESETVRLERSLQTFLDFARPPRPEKRVRDLCASIEQTLDLVQARARQQGVQIDCCLAVRPLLVEADHEQVRQVLLNLLLNALDMLPNGGTVNVAATEVVEGERSWTTLTVRDSGPGIRPDIADQIFTPYVSTKPGGLGLGLAICRQIMELHGGQIEARNASQGGAEFCIRIPSRAMEAVGPSELAENPSCPAS